MSLPGDDPRVRQALALLRHALGGDGGARAGGAAGDEEGPYHALPEPSREDPWLVSATDLLTPWSPLQLEGAPAAATAPAAVDEAAIWDTYFEGALDDPSENGDQAQPPPGAPAIGEPPPAGSAPASALEEPLLDEDADAAAACVYDFVHAVGRGDVADAMVCIDPAYHAIEDDREVDRRALQHQLERWVDQRRGFAIDASLATVPEPVAYPGGVVLIPLALQLDTCPPDGMPSSEVLQRIAVLARGADGEWKIAALSLRPDLAEPPAMADIEADTPHGAMGNGDDGG